MEFITILDIIGTIAFALSGYILGAKARLDILGIGLLSYVTAFGGGVIRDLLVDRTPFIFSETYPITVVFITILTAYFLKLHNHTKLTDNKLFMLSDSVGLTVFAYTGATVATVAGFNFGGVVFLALFTAIGGGVIRDMVLGKIPFVFTSEFYGTVALIIGIMVWYLSTIGMLTTTVSIVVLLLGLIVRLFALKYHWKLPKLV